VKRLWFKVFQMSAPWTSGPARRCPRCPPELVQELAETPSARQAAIRLLASASVVISGYPDHRDAEAECLRQNVVQYLATSEGQEQRARVNRSLAADLRARGLNVTGLE
jgi:hypothetical protein